MSILEIFLFVSIGIIVGAFWNRRKTETKEAAVIEEDPVLSEEPDLDPMTLRNDFGVYKGKKPTFAEQWVNIMNYSGENQKEEDYE